MKIDFATDPPKQSNMNPMTRLVVEFGPLGAFFVGYILWDLMTATALFIPAMLVSLAISVKLERRVPLMPLVTTVVVVIFGGLTLVLNDDTFIKMKPTIVNSLFAFALFVGLAFGRAFLKYLFGPAFQLDDEGWKKLSFRWAWLFVFLAVLNEIIWRTQTESFWVSFKVFGMMPITIVFALTQLPLIQRHTIDPDAQAAAETPGKDGEPPK
ncbi:MAG: septation protein A [Bauldia litoralis]